MSDRGITITRRAASVRRKPRLIFFGIWSAQYRTTAFKLVIITRGAPVLHTIQRNGFSSSSSGRGSSLFISIPHAAQILASPPPSPGFSTIFRDRPLRILFDPRRPRSDASNWKTSNQKHESLEISPLNSISLSLERRI